MDVKIEKKSETKREIEVTLSIEEMEQYIDKAAQRLSKEMTVKGFRPGHVPRDVVENTVGKESLFEEAARDGVEDTYPKIIEENKLFAISSPEVDLVKCAPGNEVVYKAVVYIMPEISLPDYKKISEETKKKEGKETTVSDEEIDKTLNNIRESRAKMQKVDRAAKEGDAVNINFKGIFSEDENKKVEEKNFQIVLGREDMGAIPGFEEHLVGMKADEDKKFTVDISKEGGQKIDFEVEMLVVMEREVPELTDDFAKEFPQIEGLEQLKSKIKEGMTKEKEKKDEEALRLKMLEKIKKETSFEVPEVLAKKELDNMVKTIENQLTQKGSSLDNYLEEIGKTEEELRKEWYKKAEENVSYALLLHAISKNENIEVTDEEIESEVDKHFAAMGKDKNAEKEEDLSRMRSYVYDVLKNQKVFNILK